MKRLIILTLILICGIVAISGCVNYTSETYEMPGPADRWEGFGHMYPGQYDRTVSPDFQTEFSSNGEMIYYTGFNESGQEIPISGGPHWLYVHGGSCVDCHGINGRGGVPIMMSVTIPPDITYETLTSEDGHAGEHEDDHEEHPPYTDETIKIAIREGFNPAGEEFDYIMPKWDMSDSDLDDLIEYLKTL